MVELPAEGGSLDFFLGEVSVISILNGSTVAPGVTEFSVMR
jgi:hypothetical protein